MISCRQALARVAVVLISISIPATAHADGGQLCTSEQVGSWRISVFAARSTIGSGETEFSVVVQEADSGEILSDVDVVVQARNEENGERLSRIATSEAATNKLFRSALCELTTPGIWHIAVTATAPQGESHRIEFASRITPGLPRWFDTVYLVGWPVVPIALFSIHQILLKKSSARRSASSYIGRQAT
jgi:hypothetical protein